MRCTTQTLNLTRFSIQQVLSNTCGCLVLLVYSVFYQSNRIESNRIEGIAMLPIIYCMNTVRSFFFVRCYPSSTCTSNRLSRRERTELWFLPRWMSGTLTSREKRSTNFFSFLQILILIEIVSFQQHKTHQQQHQPVLER